MKRYSPAQRRAIAISYAKKAAAAKAPARKKTYAAKSTVRKTVARKNYSKPRGSYYRGKGDYKKDYGSRLGSVVGEGIQEFFSQYNPMKILGFGDYAATPFHVMENTLLSMGNDPPEIMNARDGRFILRHREYLQDIYTAPFGAFNVNSYRINPGLESSFPWLAQVSQAFEQYKLRGMIFEFKSTASDSVATSSGPAPLGSVIMATEYDSVRPNFTSKQEMENHQYAASAKTSSSMLHPIECARDASTLTTLYVRTGSVPSDADPRMYDFGNFQIATVGQSASNSTNIGELWVTYEIELLKPMINEVGAIQSSAYFTNATGVAASTPFGSLSTMYGSTVNNLDVSFDATAPTEVHLPQGTQGTFLVVLKYTGDGVSGAVVPPTIAGSLASGTIVGNTVGPSATLLAPPPGTSSLGVMVCAYVQFVQPTAIVPDGPYFTVSGGTYPAGDVTMEMYLTAVVDGMAEDTIQPLSMASEYDDFIKTLYIEYLAKKTSEESNETPKSITGSDVQAIDDKVAALLSALKK